MERERKEMAGHILKEAVALVEAGHLTLGILHHQVALLVLDILLLH